MTILKNSKAKGSRIVRIGRRMLENEGYLFDTVEKTGRFHKQKDLFGKFDVIAIKRTPVGVNCIFIQFTTFKNKSHTHKVYQAWANEYANDTIYIQLWKWEDFFGFHIYDYMNNGTKTKTERLLK